jgi:plastocyanin domain-containing protein
VKKGEQSNSRSTARTRDNCGGEVVFSKQNIKKKLPVGETVLVELTPTEAGDIAFTCGMEMYKGKLVVSEN